MELLLRILRGEKIASEYELTITRRDLIIIHGLAKAGREAYALGLLLGMIKEKQN